MAKSKTGGKWRVSLIGGSHWLINPEQVNTLRALWWYDTGILKRCCRLLNADDARRAAKPKRKKVKHGK